MLAQSHLFKFLSSLPYGLLILLCGCAHGYGPAIRTEGTGFKFDIYVSTQDPIDEAELEGLKRQLQFAMKDFSRFEELEIPPNFYLQIYAKALATRQQSLNESTISHVDSEGRMHLVLYRDFKRYFVSLRHELVHAIRFPIYSRWIKRNRLPDFTVFFEEGLAEVLANRPSKEEADLPTIDLNSLSRVLIKVRPIPFEHLLLPLKNTGACREFVYFIRAAFMDHLISRFGVKSVMKIGNESATPTSIDQIFGAALEQHYSIWMGIQSETAPANWKDAFLKFKSESMIAHAPGCEEL